MKINLKPATARIIVILLMVGLTAYLTFQLATRGTQPIPLSTWIMYALDIIIGVVILYHIHKKEKKHKGKS